MRIACLALVVSLGAARASAATAVTEIQYVMGTYLRLTVEHDDDAAARGAMRPCFVGARHLEEVFSRFDGRSELSRLNAVPAGDRRVTVSADMAALLRRALILRQATAGTFDIGVGALTTLWRTTDRWPARAEIERARRGLGPDTLVLAGTTLTRQSEVLIDVDGVAKGWAVDRCVAVLREAGIRRAFISFGESSLYGLGAPRGRAAWPVLVRALHRESALGVLHLRDQAASVSAVFGRERQIGGQRVGHIVDPRTGLPLRRPALAVAVAASATDAEALSKAVLVGGGDTLRRVRRVLGRSEGIGAVLIDSRGVHRFGAVSLVQGTNRSQIPASLGVLE